MTDEVWEYENRYLKFSCQSLELSIRPGEHVEGKFSIETGSPDAEGNIYSSDTRMQNLVTRFKGEEVLVEYCFNGANLEAGSLVRGEFIVISNRGEYTLPYRIMVQKPVLQSSLGNIRNLFHFANLAKTNWEEAVELFYSPDFISIFHKNDKNYETAYLGLSRAEGNQENVEEFLIETNKKTPVTVQMDIEGFVLEDVLDSTSRTLTLTRSGWGYLQLTVKVEGEFISLMKQKITREDFVNDTCRLDFTIDATKLHHGMNVGRIVIANTCNELTVPVSVMMNDAEQIREREQQEKRAVLAMMKSYIEMKFRKISKEAWIERSAEAIDVLKELDEDNLMTQLYQVQMLIAKERFHEAKWYLDQLEKRVFNDKSGVLEKCYYLYLETLFNRDESYIQAVTDEIENAYAEDETQWRLAWFLLYLDGEYAHNPEAKWDFLREQFKLGCTSPVLFCDAVLLFQSYPAYILQLGDFEQNVLWYAAKYHMMSSDMIEQLQYLCARVKTYSSLLFRTLCEVYQTNRDPQTIAAICRLLILGDKRGNRYFHWYELGVEKEVRVTKLYEYYMMSIDITDTKKELPKMVLMYFAYQSNLDYERNAYLYAYVLRNKDRYPELERNYRIAMERFVVDQIKIGHINENLAYLYENILAPQMLRDDTAYAFTPLLFMHKITVENPKIRSVIIIHEKINGESSYPVMNHTCMLPIYGSEYKLFLQDEEGNRYTKRIPYTNRALCQTEKLLPFVGPLIEGRLSFDIYLCEQDKNYVTITSENVKRFKHLVDSEQVIESFKKEIRTKLLRFYYENDMIGELDTFLDETEAEAMEPEERAEFIRFLISRGMFDKAYLWVKRFGMSGVNPKSVARLVSKRIVSNQYTKESFLVNVAFYIYKNMKYDENILQYLMMYYEGRTTDLRNIWKSAAELELDTSNIMYRILQQMRFTHVIVQEKDEILLSYAALPRHDENLVEEFLLDTAYAYFVKDAVTEPKIFDSIYLRYRRKGELDIAGRLALLKFWAENPQERAKIDKETISEFVDDLLHADLYFPFYKELSEDIPQLHYFRDKSFIEYKAPQASVVRIHYRYDEEGTADAGESSVCYETEEMKDMYEGIRVKTFSLFQGEALQYYITETQNGEEHVTQSDTLFGNTESHAGGRFSMLNDIMVALSMQEDATVQQLVEEYLAQDCRTRELFRVI